MRWLAVERWMRGLVEACEPEFAARNRFSVPDSAARPALRRGALDREVRVQLRGGAPTGSMRAPGAHEMRVRVDVDVIVRFPALKTTLGRPDANSQLASDAVRLMRALHQAAVIGEGADQQSVACQPSSWTATTEPDGVPAARIAAAVRYMEAAA